MTAHHLRPTRAIGHRLALMLACAAAIALGIATQARAAPYAAMVMDARDGRVLYERNADARLHPASLTKMMTLYIAFDAIERGEISVDQMVTISANAAREPRSKLGLRTGAEDQHAPPDPRGGAALCQRRRDRHRRGDLGTRRRHSPTA